MPSRYGQSRTELRQSSARVRFFLSVSADLGNGNKMTRPQRKENAIATSGVPLRVSRANPSGIWPFRASANVSRALAARELEACGALRYRDEAERELRKLGHRIHRRTRPDKTAGTGIESLTEREQQVARFVVDDDLSTAGDTVQPSIPLPPLRRRGARRSRRRS
jgi:hypothetical protein